MGWSQPQFDPQSGPGIRPAQTYGVRSEAVERTFFAQVYSWMALGLALTAASAWVTLATPGLIETIVRGRMFFWVLVIGEIVLVGYFSARIHQLSYGEAVAVFLAYSAINGLTLSILFLVYTMASVVSTFLLTAGTFGLMSMYGHATKTDLTSWGNVLLMGLIGVILASVTNLFLGSPAVYWATTFIGVLVFVGLTAYDTQRLKALEAATSDGSETEKKMAMAGALALYLDFVNLFLYLLRFTGRRKE